MAPSLISTSEYQLSSRRQANNVYPRRMLTSLLGCFATKQNIHPALTFSLHWPGVCRLFSVSAAIVTFKACSNLSNIALL
jgi:hypothetical protein